MLISDEKISNNVLLYKSLKAITKAKFTSAQLFNAREILLKSPIDNRAKNKLINDFKLVKEKNVEDLYELLNYFEYNCSIEQIIDYLKITIDLLAIKGVIMEQSKVRAGLYMESLLSEISDKLSLSYDFSTIDRPYSFRVIGSIFTEISTNGTEDDMNNLLMGGNTGLEYIKILKSQYENIKSRYEIELFEVFSLLVNESVNQSITSRAGSSYEDRVKNTLYSISEDIEDHKHDRNRQEVEYDFIYKVDGFRIGVSAKRTLRERYKQNWIDVESLEVDFMSLITLGVDLNEAKLNTILDIPKTFVIVSSEIYDKTEYMINNPRVISSVDFNKENISRLIATL